MARVLSAALSKPLKPDACLSAVIGAEAVSRGEIIKRLWAYVKKNGLQDSVNKRNINADSLLLPFFGGKKQITMFEMAKFVNDHISK